MQYIRYNTIWVWVWPLDVHTHLATFIEKCLEAGGWIDTNIAVSTWQ